MIISHKHKFIFIKTYKTAGTSVERHLERYCGQHDVVTPIYPEEKGHIPRNYSGFWLPRSLYLDSGFLKRELADLTRRRKFYNHCMGINIRGRLPCEIWTTYFKFAVERNPWDKFISHYNMISNMENNQLTLEEYLTRGPLPINYPLYTDMSGALILDKVCKYEDLDNDLGEVFAQIGIPYDGQLTDTSKPGTLTAVHGGDRAAEYLGPDLYKKIAEIFEQEISMWGY